jgi:HAD superfamily hydrolase (TIGR01490 family)
LALAIFDLDETLIAGDSDHAWFEFLIEERLIDGDEYRAQNDAFYRQYREGALDIDAYLAVVCTILAGLDQGRLDEYRSNFLETRIKPMFLPAAMDLVDNHRRQGDLPLVITSTLDFIVEPIIQLYGIDNLIAPVAEIRDGRYTGKSTGIPSYQAGKVKRLGDWMTQKKLDLEGSYFYTDSFNDIPLLAEVPNPVAVDPDARLRAEEVARGWDVISLRPR